MRSTPVAFCIDEGMVVLNRQIVAGLEICMDGSLQLVTIQAGL